VTASGGASANARPAASWRRILSLHAGALAAVFCLAAATVAAENTAGPLANPLEGRADVVDEGRSLFNQYCAHCHGTNAYQGERSRDLRRLKLRYQSQASRIFYEAVSNGRMDKGMPVWKSVLSDDLVWRIFTFLETVQTPP
jgi:polar amino acid transport system substrate-binding protein